MTSQIAEREDHIVTSDMQDFYYGTLQFTRSDEIAATLQVLVTAISRQTAFL